LFAISVVVFLFDPFELDSAERHMMRGHERIAARVIRGCPSAVHITPCEIIDPDADDSAVLCVRRFADSKRFPR
jgi:hypothetical protein